MRRGSGKEKRFPPTGTKGSVEAANDEGTGELQGVGEHSKEFREGARRTLRFPTNGHAIIEPVRFLWRNVLLFCLSCASCASMFKNPGIWIHGTTSWFPTGHEISLFHSRMIRPPGRGQNLFETIELFAKFAAGQVILPANVRFCLFQYRVRLAEKCCLTTKGTKSTRVIICVFVPFVAIPGNCPATEFCKRLNPVHPCSIGGMPVYPDRVLVPDVSGRLLVSLSDDPHGRVGAGLT